MRGLFGRWAARGGLIVIVMGVFGFAAAQGAQAAVPNGSLTPFLNCYWDNGDDTVTVLIGVKSTNAGINVSVPVGAQNRVTLGNADRGQPETFNFGTQNNVWTFTVSYADISAGMDWQLTGNSVSVDAVKQCATKPQLSTGGNGIAFLAFGAFVTLVGGFFLNGRRHRKTGLEMTDAE